MGLGTSLFLIAVGAILRFAVTITTNGINLQTVGLIVLIIGAVGLVISCFWMAVAADRGPRRDLPPDRASRATDRYAPPTEPRF